MKPKISFIALLLLMAMLLGSCTNTPDLPQNTEPPILDSTTETPTEKPADPFESLRSSGEEWISYGIAAFESGKQIIELIKNDIKPSDILTQEALQRCYKTGGKTKKSFLSP